MRRPGRRGLTLTVALTLTGLFCSACDPERPWHHGDLPRIPVEIDGRVVTVLDHGGGRYDAFGGGDFRTEAMRTIQRRQIAAIEKYAGEKQAGCSVKQAVYLPGEQILQTIVTC